MEWFFVNKCDYDINQNKVKRHLPQAETPIQATIIRYTQIDAKLNKVKQYTKESLRKFIIIKKKILCYKPNINNLKTKQHEKSD